MTQSPLNALWRPDYDPTTVTQVGRLPIRGEKRLVPIDVPQNPDNGGETAPTSFKYEALSYAKQTLTDYVTIRIPSRIGETTSDMFTYRFLINPKSIAISRQTMDSQVMSRSGWQLGIWGEDTIDINLQGSTAGQYFEGGLTDRWEEFTLSYRNLMELMNVFENNGYWFEGEEANTLYSAPDFTRKRIKAHGDVQLCVGNFIWHGMFTDMTVNQTADTPYFNTFELGFLAWKERFKASSPWLSPIVNNVSRGHDTDVLMRLSDQMDKDLEKEEAIKEEAKKATDPMFQDNTGLVMGNGFSNWGNAAAPLSTGSEWITKGMTNGG